MVQTDPRSVVGKRGVTYRGGAVRACEQLERHDRAVTDVAQGLAVAGPRLKRAVIAYGPVLVNHSC